ncbi:MAG: hypothetical protein RSC52_00370 [Oscillospiraceae bacterium]
MTKWDYIRLISAYGDRCGYNGGIYDLLVCCKKLSTREVTEEEARAFWEELTGEQSCGEKK